MLSGSSHISSIIERTKRREKIQKVVEDKLSHILVLWQKLMMSSSYFEKKTYNLSFDYFFEELFMQWLKTYLTYKLETSSFGVHIKI
jgi:hypothetical protein